MKCRFCPGQIYAKYRREVEPVYRCRLCRRIYVPQDRPIYLPGGAL